MKRTLRLLAPLVGILLVAGAAYAGWIAKVDWDYSRDLERALTKDANEAGKEYSEDSTNSPEISSCNKGLVTERLLRIIRLTDESFIHHTARQLKNVNEVRAPTRWRRFNQYVVMRANLFRDFAIATEKVNTRADEIFNEVKPKTELKFISALAEDRTYRKLEDEAISLHSQLDQNTSAFEHQTPERYLHTKIIDNYVEMNRGIPLGILKLKDLWARETFPEPKSPVESLNASSTGTVSTTAPGAVLKRCAVMVVEK